MRYNLKVFPALRRRVVKSPRARMSLLVFLFFFLPFLVLRHWYNGDLGRWYWNYAVSLHPIFAHIEPGGIWGHPSQPPKFFPEIYSAPWMGEFSPPRLTKPVYKDGQLISPVILKLHVFSTIQSKDWEKRRLLRRHSYLNNISPAYRHLIEIKFVLGHAYKEDWAVDTELELLLAEEQRIHGDLIRLNLEHGENLREGKILDWIHAAGDGSDGGRPGWYLFKVDDDTVLNLPLFLDTLLEQDPSKPIYLGTSLNRWPDYHHHFTGMLTGFSWPLVKTLSAGIAKTPRSEIIAWHDDDVLTGELMFCLPSGPQCNGSLADLPRFCDPHEPPEWGYHANPPAIDPRTDLIRYDYLRRLGDEAVWFIKGDVARHSWFFKAADGWVKEWKSRIQGLMWTPPKWLEQYAADE